MVSVGHGFFQHLVVLLGRLNPLLTIDLNCEKFQSLLDIDAFETENTLPVRQILRKFEKWILKCIEYCLFLVQKFVPLA